MSDRSRSFTRREALRWGGLVGVAAATAVGSSGPALARSGRAVLTHGVQSGDISADGALVWTRADRVSRMVVEVSPSPSFDRVRRVAGPALTEDTDFTGRLRLSGLAPGREWHYRVVAEDLDGRVRSEPLAGAFRTAPRGVSGVRLLWSGDVVGQGWGINPDVGGMTIFSTMAGRDPDLFINSGDTVYSDRPVPESITLPDGRTWRNVTTEAKSKVAETLPEFRGQFAYNLLDESYRRFAARVPQLVQWDDHEVFSNWYPGQVLDGPEAEPYTERRVDVLAARALQAFHEWMPLDVQRAVDGRVYRRVPYGPLLEVFVLDMRTYRSPNEGTIDPYEPILGDRQSRWLVESLSASRATWKIIAADLPLGSIIPNGYEAVSNSQDGPPYGREAEIAAILSELSRRSVRNLVWLTADVHYTAAHHYSPDRAVFPDFDPFWEFVSGPLHAGAYGANRLDNTFGPEAVFVHAAPEPNTSPLDGYQHFGEIDIDGPSGELTVTLRNQTGSPLWSKHLRPHR